MTQSMALGFRVGFPLSLCRTVGTVLFHWGWGLRVQTNTVSGFLLLREAFGHPGVFPALPSPEDESRSRLCVGSPLPLRTEAAWELALTQR